MRLNPWPLEYPRCDCPHQIVHDIDPCIEAIAVGYDPVKDFDLDHEGHWGWRVDEVLVQLDGWAKVAKPDVVLIHLGTNDIAQQQDLKETVAELKQVITELRGVNLEVKVLIAQIIPLLGSEAQCKEFNGQLQVLARQMTTKQAPVVVVDQFTGFRAEPGKDTDDGAHPNATGEQKMAHWWLSAEAIFEVALLKVRYFLTVATELRSLVAAQQAISMESTKSGQLYLVGL
jgi:GDSL-like Lipase/Acylhydrolase family